MISKNFDIGHIDIINTKIKYFDINTLKAEIFPYEGDEAKTYINDDRIIFSCGIRMIRHGVGHCWVVPSVYIDKHAKYAVCEINRLLDEYSKKMQLHRIQTTVEEPFVKWIENLGFEREGVLKKITPDKRDEYMYVKFY